MEKKDLISIGEASVILGKSIDTLRRWDKNGKLKAFKSTGGQRLYSHIELVYFSNILVKLAEEWAFEHLDTSSDYYCADTSVFQARLNSMVNVLFSDKKIEAITPLVGAVVGEIGSNSFDHNIGNWPDAPGVFFGYDIKTRVVVLADRGQGVFATLKRVRPNLRDSVAAIDLAFSEVVTGRAPENRGNGLKFVRKVIGENKMGLIFKSGVATLTLIKDEDELDIKRSSKELKGCLALIIF